MAAGTKCKMRLYLSSHDRVKFSAYKHQLQRIGVGYANTLKIIELTYAASFSNGFVEISPPNAVFDGTSSAVVVHAISTDAKDTSAGVGVRQIRLIGLDENSAITYEDITLNGATGVATITKWKRIFHAYAIAWGSEGDAAGDITIQNAAEDTTYLTIGAGANESDGSALWFADGYYASVGLIGLSPTSQAAAARSIAVQIDRTKFNGETDPDLSYHVYKAAGEGNTLISPADVGEFWEADADAKLTFKETYLGGAMDGFVKIEIICFDPSNSGRGLYINQ